MVIRSVAFVCLLIFRLSWSYDFLLVCLFDSTGFYDRLLSNPVLLPFCGYARAVLNPLGCVGSESLYLVLQIVFCSNRFPSLFPQSVNIASNQPMRFKWFQPDMEDEMVPWHRSLFLAAPLHRLHLEKILLLRPQLSLTLQY